MNFDLLYSQNDNSGEAGSRIAHDEERISKDSSRFFRVIIKNTISKSTEGKIKSSEDEDASKK